MPRHPALLFVLLAAPAVHGQAAPKEVDFTPLEAVAKKELVDSAVPGAVVVIVQGDRVVYAKGFGVTSVEGTEVPTPDHLFRIGSTTKVFVGMVLVKLAEAGKLKLDAPVGKLIDGLPPELSALTPQQLLTHTAGLPDESDMFGRHDDEALGASIKKWTADKLFTKPGDVYSYSSPGYWMAGYVAERAAGKPFADVMATELFSPLGMKRTTFRPTMAMTYPLALGHEVRGGKPVVVRPAADNAATWPAGSMYTSGTDMARFMIAFLHEGKVDGKPALTASLVKTVTAPHAAVPGEGHYGYGIHVEKVRGVDVWTHNGSRVGHGSRLTMAPGHGFGLFIVANRSGASMPRTAAKALELALPFEPAAKRDAGPKPAADQLAVLAGVYRNGPRHMDLKWADGALSLVEAKKGGPVEPLGGEKFRAEDGERFEALTGCDGATAYLFRSGRAYRKDDAK
ncbi:serine hydrolase domain-containing protein [Gemmata sp.]|uniref:serine hydrolase domain-containing protein n=1 Tax=Gemmata sp. TaxID=1914242 RepID=UPI003F6F6F4B